MLQWFWNRDFLERNTLAWGFHTYQILSASSCFIHILAFFTRLGCPFAMRRRSASWKYFGDLETSGKTPKFGIKWVFPKWMVYNGKPYENRWFGGTTIFGNIQMIVWWYIIIIQVNLFCSQSLCPSQGLLVARNVSSSSTARSLPWKRQLSLSKRLNGFGVSQFASEYQRLFILSRQGCWVAFCKLYPQFCYRNPMATFSVVFLFSETLQTDYPAFVFSEIPSLVWIVWAVFRRQDVAGDCGRPCRNLLRDSWHFGFKSNPNLKYVCFCFF